MATFRIYFSCLSRAHKPYLWGGGGVRFFFQRTNKKKTIENQSVNLVQAPSICTEPEGVRIASETLKGT